MTSKVSIQSLNPPGLAKPMGYSHAVVAETGRTIYIGGQNAIDENGALVGGDDLGKQSEKILENIGKILKSAGGDLDNLVKLNIYLKQGQNPMAGFQAFQKWWGKRETSPAVTVVFVAGLGHPDWLAEIDGIAILTE